MNGPLIEEAVCHPAETGWLQWGGHGGATLCFKQPGIYDPFRQGCETALGHCHAIQHSQQRRATGLLALHEREARMDLSRCFGQGQGGIAGTRPHCANRTGTTTQQGKLVRPNLACSGYSRRVGNIFSVVAKRYICPLEAERRIKAKAKTSITEKHNVLSVVRINGHPNKSVHRRRSRAHTSVHRTYSSHFKGLPLSVHRTPSSNTTPCAPLRLMRIQ